jgi:hypothetical protein
LEPVPLLPRFLLNSQKAILRILLASQHCKSPPEPTSWHEKKQLPGVSVHLLQANYIWVPHFHCETGNRKSFEEASSMSSKTLLEL